MQLLTMVGKDSQLGEVCHSRVSKGTFNILKWH